MPESERNPATRLLGWLLSYTGADAVQASSSLFNRLIGVSVQQAAENGHPENADVKPRRPVRDVVEVVLEPFAEGGIAPPAVHLRPAGDTSFYAVAGHVVRNRLPELVNENRPLRPRTDQA